MTRSHSPALLALSALALSCLSTIATAGRNGEASEPAQAFSDPVPGDSLYQLPVDVETATGATLSLAHFRGRTLIVTMFYAGCTSVCPLLTSALQRVDRQLLPAERERTQVLMVSLDPARDTPAELARFSAEHHISDPRWVVARTSASNVRLLAAALGIRYRELPDHSFNHSAVVSVADRSGVVRGRTSDLLRLDEAFVATIRSLIDPGGVDTTRHD